MALNHKNLFMNTEWMFKLIKLIKALETTASFKTKGNLKQQGVAIKKIYQEVYNLEQNIWKFFSRYGIVSLHYKWNKTRLLSLERKNLRVASQFTERLRT